MRANEFITEVLMNPSNLKKLAGQTGAIAGMEFEMIVPTGRDYEDDFGPNADYSDDPSADSIDEICDFFEDREYNSRHQIERLRVELSDQFIEWLDEQIDYAWRNEGSDYFRDYIYNNNWDEDGEIFTYLSDSMGLSTDEVEAALDAGNKRYMSSKEVLAAREGNEAFNNYMIASEAVEEKLTQYVEDEWSTAGRLYDEVFDQYRDDEQSNYDQHDFLREQGITHMSDVSDSYDVSWIYWTYNDSSDYIEGVAKNFGKAIGRRYRWSDDYHSIKREPNTYTIEPDSSLEPDSSNNELGLEFISPPLPIADMISDLNKVVKWAGTYGCYTNESTGLHMNVSIPNFDLEQLDYVKLALLLGDEYVLQQFGRQGNEYCKSSMEEIVRRVEANPTDAEALLGKMKTGLSQIATKIIHSGNTSKYVSINTKTGYIEFRSPGGDWLNEDFTKLETTLMRFAVALSAAMDPQAFRQDYLKKLYAILKPQSSLDPVAGFAQYAAGIIDKATLKYFIKHVQQRRKFDKGILPSAASADEQPTGPWELAPGEF